ncbi:trypsin-like peptidase domain-containing protein [Blattabacterium cuenoti]|uniref:trypsin-like peptidase domain-containing protein n=1 Tax=Blattabacterium cuenoti TaxID=1653831 RepID=UPI00163C1D6D|nr:trypsin-like peptidase domain-containing protein [Blattabacterium cuenoti]
MKKIIFYVIISSIISSIITMTTYTKYTQQQNESNFLYNTTYPLRFKWTNPMLISSSNDHGFPDFTKAVSKTINAVVNIQNFSKSYSNENEKIDFDPFDLFFGFPDSYRRNSIGLKFKNKGKGKGIKNHYNNNIDEDEEEIQGIHGSGVIISSDGYIVTNYHVIENANKIEVTLNNQRSYNAKLIGKDSSTDIALLKINEKGLPFISFSDSNKVQVGEWVLAIGNPFDLNSTVTAGIISAKNRHLGILKGENQHVSPIESFFQTDAAVNPGNSGGALVNTNGELIGINTAISSNSGNYIGYSFAAPSNIVIKVVQDIKKYGFVQRACLGIKGIELAKIECNIKSKSGLLIEKIYNQSGAYDAGLKIGDIIKNINGHPIQNISDLSMIIGTKSPGDKLQVTFLRKHNIMDCDVVLKNSEKENKDEEENNDKNQTEITNNKPNRNITQSYVLGGTFKKLEIKDKKNYGIHDGIKVVNININGKLNEIGINVGDIIISINGKKIKNPQDVDNLLKKYDGYVTLKAIKLNGDIYIASFNIH